MNAQKNPSPSYTCPCGTNDVLEPLYFTYQGFYEKASEIALYYGFKPIILPALEHESLYTDIASKWSPRLEKELYTLKAIGNERLVLRPDGRVGSMRAYIEHRLYEGPQPTMLFYYSPFYRHVAKNKSDVGHFCEYYKFGLEVIGTSKSVTDASIIKIFATILQDAKITDQIVEINSMGDAESRPAFIKEIQNFIKKYGNNLSAATKQAVKSNPLSLYSSTDKKDLPLIADAPDPMSTLTPSAKKHMREVCEYLDALEIPYTIAPHLVREEGYYTNTVFRIRDADKDPTEVKEKPKSAPNTSECKEARKDMEEKGPITYASGGRHDSLSKLLGYKKSVPGVGGTISVDSVVRSPQHTPFDSRIQKKPKVFLIQLGFEAKLKSMKVIEVFRKAKLPILHSLSKDRLAAQLAVAEKLHIPYTVILGQREAIDDTVIVRSMDNRSQKTVPIKDLHAYARANLK